MKESGSATQYALHFHSVSHICMWNINSIRYANMILLRFERENCKREKITNSSLSCVHPTSLLLLFGRGGKQFEFFPPPLLRQQTGIPYLLSIFSAFLNIFSILIHKTTRIGNKNEHPFVLKRHYARYEIFIQQCGEESIF
jgi:hypothetical protein